MYKCMTMTQVISQDATVALAPESWLHALLAFVCTFALLTMRLSSPAFGLLLEAAALV
eukprot:m.7241 g.7241  ORF g.7241 m.7241 type:complete len:58 (-) comp8759_c0_seq1:778-951(-)